jgi:hypothetical protein
VRRAAAEYSRLLVIGTVAGMKHLTTALLLAWTLTTAACSTTPSTETTTSGADTSADLACIHYSNVTQDVHDGILTDTELRQKWKEINDTASASTTPGIAVNARAALAAISTGTVTEFAVAVQAFSDACAAVAH